MKNLNVLPVEKFLNLLLPKRKGKSFMATKVIDDDNDVIVFLDQKRIVGAVSYNIEEDWVEIIDHSKLNLPIASKDFSPDLSMPDVLDTFPTRRLHGKITVRKFRKDI